MADLTVTSNSLLALEQSSVIPQNAFIKQLFDQYGYHQILQHAGFIYFGQIRHLFNSIIFDLIVIRSVEDLQEAEDALPLLERECRHIQQEIIRGTFTLPNPIIKKTHHFLTLKKSYQTHSYLIDGQPIGFSIRPLIFLTEQDLWEYFISPKGFRIDVITLSNETLSLYLNQHEQDLAKVHSKLVQPTKTRAWYSSQILLDYGYIPLLLLWIINLFLLIFQLPPLLSIDSMIALTALGYGSFIGFAFLSYHYFQRVQRHELEVLHLSFSNNPAASSTPTLKWPVPSQELGEARVRTTQQEYESPPEIHHIPIIPEESHRQRPLTGHPSQSEDLKKQIYRIIQKVILSSDSQSLENYVIKLFRNLLKYLLANQTGEVPSGSFEIHLKLAQGCLSNEHYRALQFWIRKIDTRTPFNEMEIRVLKKFCLYLLFDLTLLPPHLQQKVAAYRSPPSQISSFPPTMTLDKITNPPKEHPSSIALALKRQIAELQAQFQELDSSTPDTPSPSNPVHSSSSLISKTPPLQIQQDSNIPNLEVDSLPLPSLKIHSKIPSITPSQLSKLQEHPRNGVYCILLLDMRRPDAGNVLARFEAVTQDLFNVTLHHHDIGSTRESSPFLRHDISIPATLIGIGPNYQVIPFQEVKDENLLYQTIESYCMPQCSLSLRPKDSRGQDANDRAPTSSEAAVYNPSSTQNRSDKVHSTLRIRDYTAERNTSRTPPNDNTPPLLLGEHCGHRSAPIGRNDQIEKEPFPEELREKNN
ncbi:MAG: hypothetical protein ACTSRS_13170 [Candidatus Helarchaeota archaeon]